MFVLSSRDEVFSEFERAVVGTFGDVWFSVCFYVTSDVPQGILPENAPICIGAKVDETKFIEVVQPSNEIKRQFTEKYKYIPPKRKYHDGKFRSQEKKPKRLN